MNNPINKYNLRKLAVSVSFISLLLTWLVFFKPMDDNPMKESTIPPVGTKDFISSKFEGLVISSIIPVADSGILLIKTNNGAELYTNKEADIVLIKKRNGTMSFYDTSGEKPTDIRDDLLAPYNKSIMKDAVKNEDGALNKSLNEKYRVLVFIDPACGYCHKFNENMSSYLDKGISIQYMPFPIFGARSTEILYRIWSLAPELRADALNMAQEHLIANPKSNDIDAMGLSPATEEGKALVDKYKQAAILLGFSGTPGIYLESGKLVRGYVSADNLEQIIKEG